MLWKVISGLSAIFSFECGLLGRRLSVRYIHRATFASLSFSFSLFGRVVVVVDTPPPSNNNNNK